MKNLSFPMLVFVALFSPALALAATGTAKIAGTAQGSPITGEVRFEDTQEGLKVTAKVQNVPAGKHGFHIHETGSCDDGGKAAGGHYNPEGVPHGDVVKNGLAAAHAGDLGNIEIGADGKGELEKTIPGVNLSGGKFNVAGKSVILHEKEDDFGQPTGNAGGRIGCGVIEEAKS